ncbi:MAG TPA: glycosyltransferase family A protein [Mangrovimonas sp.]|nr:glycosyltransferase family A protein [Mangrovimonas sp.]
MQFTLIVCTYMRSDSLLRLLNSVRIQTLCPDKILIIDGSTNQETQKMIEDQQFKNLEYFLVGEEYRGLTKQRNFGISKISESCDVICFLDDDTELETNYFEEVIGVFNSRPEVVGVGGVATNENRWQKKQVGKAYNSKNYYELEGYVYPEGLRNKVRNYLGLSSPLPSNCMPEFSHGRTNGYPLTGKVYEVDLLIGMSMAFRRRVFDSIQFSSYFEGYGLYEDADFSIQASQLGKNVIATSARLGHYHDISGRPNMYKYGKMVLRNGWYVWRVKYPNPSFKAKFKWHAIHFILWFIRILNVITTSKRKEAFFDALGRFVGWCSLFFNKPKVRL